MAGVTISLTLNAAVAQAALARLTDSDIDDMAYAVGQLIENQTKERIATGKRSPDGEPWSAWSRAYAQTRSARHSLLVGDDANLMGSIQNYTMGRVAEVGTPLIYGAIHQFGGAGAGKPGLPGREYLGLSDEDRREIEALVIDSLEGQLQ